MKSYISIEKWSPLDFGKHIFGFYKIDGSNFRVEWDKKLSKKSRFTFGFKKFGTRNQMIHENNPFYEGVELFKKKYSENLDRIFTDNKTFRGINRITVFGEFYGESSFAGIHNWNEIHDIQLFDVFLYKKGYLPPAEFIKVFEDLDTAKKIFQGPFNENFLQKIEHNTFDLEEGMVCKGLEDNKVFMFKVKTDQWLNKVREMYGVEKMLEY